MKVKRGLRHGMFLSALPDGRGVSQNEARHVPLHHDLPRHSDTREYNLSLLSRQHDSSRPLHQQAMAYFLVQILAIPPGDYVSFFSEITQAKANSVCTGRINHFRRPTGFSRATLPIVLRRCRVQFGQDPEHLPGMCALTV